MRQEIEKRLNENDIKEYLEHFSWVDFNLYWQEYYIAEKILPVLKNIKKSDYSYSYTEFWWDTFEASAILFILDKLWFLEFWTSIRNGWIRHNLRNVFDIFILLLEQDYNNINFVIENDVFLDDYDKDNIEHINYIKNKLWTDTKI